MRDRVGEKDCGQEDVMMEEALLNRFLCRGKGVVIGLSSEGSLLLPFT